MEKPRLARLTTLLTQLQTKPLVTATELADFHGVSIRTIYRDIRTLELSGVPIVTEEGKGYSLLEGYTLPPIMLTEEEAQALITAEQIIRRNKDRSFIEKYQGAITKIKAVFKHSVKAKADLLANRIQIRENQDNERSSNLLIQLQTALVNYQVLRIEYHSLQGKLTERDIEPFAMYSTQENWLLVAYCRMRRDFRAFRLDRVLRVKDIGERFEPHGMTLQDYFDMCRQKTLAEAQAFATENIQTIVSS